MVKQRVPTYIHTYIHTHTPGITGDQEADGQTEGVPQTEAAADDLAAKGPIPRYLLNTSKQHISCVCVCIGG
jgi:hypothetical protein